MRTRAGCAASSRRTEDHSSLPERSRRSHDQIGVIRAAAEEQRARYQPDPWQEKVEQFAAECHENETFLTVSYVLSQLNIEVGRQSQSEANRVAGAFKRQVIGASRSGTQEPSSGCISVRAAAEGALPPVVTSSFCKLSRTRRAEILVNQLVTHRQHASATPVSGADSSKPIAGRPGIR